MTGRDAAVAPRSLARTVRTRVWFVAQWGPMQDRGSPASAPECFRTVRVDSLEEAMAVAYAGALALKPDAPWLAGGRVSKVLFPTEGAATETDRWILIQPDGDAVWRRV